MWWEQQRQRRPKRNKNTIQLMGEQNSYYMNNVSYDVIHMKIWMILWIKIWKVRIRLISIWNYFCAKVIVNKSGK